MAMTDAQAESWSRKRSRGWFRRVATWFVIMGCFGVATGIAITAIVHGEFDPSRLLVRRFVGFGLLGAFVNVLVWHLNQLAYERWAAKSAGQASTHPPVAGRWIERRGRRLAVIVVMLVGFAVWEAGSVFVLHRLDNRVEAALEEGRAATVQAEARWLIALAQIYPLHWCHGNAVMHGHVALGLVAAEDGDLEAAREHLHAAGSTPGSPQLDSFGPNMLLAQALLERGEREIVLAYFDQCRDFWRFGDDELDAWSVIVRSGGMPDFRANLSY